MLVLVSLLLLIILLGKGVEEVAGQEMLSDAAHAKVLDLEAMHAPGPTQCHVGLSRCEGASRFTIIEFRDEPCASCTVRAHARMSGSCLLTHLPSAYTSFSRSKGPTNLQRPFSKRTTGYLFKAREDILPL